MALALFSKDGLLCIPFPCSIVDDKCTSYLQGMFERYGTGLAVHIFSPRPVFESIVIGDCTGNIDLIRLVTRRRI